MKENVGTIDQMMRSVAGPALIALGYKPWGGENGHPAGLLAMMGGAAIIDSAITRVCPVNAALGIDTREPQLLRSDVSEQA